LCSKEREREGERERERLRRARERERKKERERERKIARERQIERQGERERKREIERACPVLTLNSAASAAATKMFGGGLHNKIELPNQEFTIFHSSFSCILVAFLPYATGINHAVMYLLLIIFKGF
jgi:hypothetical protein